MGYRGTSATVVTLGALPVQRLARIGNFLRTDAVQIHHTPAFADSGYRTRPGAT